jgi:uncharacterized membrane protein YfcA
VNYLIICITAFLGSCLTFFSGFGLGTLLVPVFSLFFPVELAIALTAIVHFLNNLFKFALVGKAANKKIIFDFGIPALTFSIVGAYTLFALTDMHALTKYSIFERTFVITPVKVITAIIIIFFSLFELVPRLSKMSIASKWLPLGGILTGFFGGISGNQGALRSAFLAKANLTKQAFIATGVVLALLIDFARLTIYSENILKSINDFNILLVSLATLSAFLGAYIGNKILKKITLKTLQKLIGIMLMIFSVLLAAGIV